MMYLRWDFPDADVPKTLGADEQARRQTPQRFSESSTAVGEMLVSLLHMQVYVCYLRQGRGRRHKIYPRSGTGIIAFPRGLSESKQPLNVWTNLAAGDVANVAPIVDPTVVAHPGELVRRHVVELDETGFLVEIDGQTHVYVDVARVR